jgi:catechol 2,3-dioxygenase-like lactoylglutathione lyase family enzyme
MSLAHGRVEARLPAKDLARAKRWYAEKLGLLPAEQRDAEVTELRRRGVVFEDYGIPGLAMSNNVVDIPDNYPSKGRAERGAWFRDSEGNMLGIGQAVT